jgi:hypothetical protein
MKRENIPINHAATKNLLKMQRNWMIRIDAMPAQQTSVATKTWKCTWKGNTKLTVQAVRQLSKHKMMFTSMRMNAM